MNTRLTLFAIALVSLSSLKAVPIVPYSNPGTPNPTTYTFTAAGNGNVTAYFAGSSANYGSTIGLSINGAAPTLFGLQNHSSAVGTSLVLGSVSNGDVLRFQLGVNATGPGGPPPLSYTLNSDASFNPSSANHIYSYAYAGDLGLGLPAGTYLGFEDISPLASGDRDYNDHQFVFTGPGLNSVPDGGTTVLMLLTAGAGLGLLRRKLPLSS